MRIAFVAPDAPGWGSAATFIAAEFARSHGAQIKVAPITLAVAQARDGRILGAAGLRFATEGFFSECYLEMPVAEALTRASQSLVRADEVIEVVSLACPAPLAILPLIEAIVTEGRRHGMTWGLFTATAPLARLLERTGASLLRLVPAQPGRLEQPESWGRYYASEPWVCALPDRDETLRFMPRAALLRAARKAATPPGEQSACA